MSISNSTAEDIVDTASFGLWGADPGLYSQLDDEEREIAGDPLDILGTRAADDIREAEEEQLTALDEAQRQEILARREAQQYFSPFAGVAESAIDQAGFLTDQNAQFDFLQNNPLFQASLQNANRATNAAGAAGGRFNAGDTLSQLSNNFLTTASPLIQDQKNSILDLLGLGQGIATSQANTAIGQGTALSGLAQNAGNVRAASAAAQAANQQQATNNTLQLGGALLAAFSDSRLKDNAEIIGSENGYDVWKWTWNKDAWEKFALRGESQGVMFSEVLEKNPEATSYQDGYGKVNYSMIGVQHA